MKKLSVVTRMVGWLLLGALLVSAGIAPQAAYQMPWQDKVELNVLAQASRGETEFVILLKEQADLSGAATLETKKGKGQYVFERLTEVAGRTQKPVLEALAGDGAEFRSYWIANMIWARGGVDIVQRMAQREDVRRIYANPQVQWTCPYESLVMPESLIILNGTLISQCRAGMVRLTGQGVVIGGQDTGYEWDHPALKEHYRGWDGSTVDHNYHWHDAVHYSYGNPCGSNATEPCDDSDHGTHTMGIMVGVILPERTRSAWRPGRNGSAAVTWMKVLARQSLIASATSGFWLPPI
jgi:subtilisin family serine protease